MESYVSVCPKCGRVYRHESVKAQICTGASCRNIGTVFTGCTVEEWDSLSGEEKEDIYRKKGLNALLADVNTVSSGTAASASGEGGTSMWFSLLNTVTNLGIFLGILGSFIGGIALFDVNDILGMLVIVVGTVVTLVSVASVKVILGAAKDIRYIRNRMHSWE